MVGDQTGAGLRKEVEYTSLVFQSITHMGPGFSVLLAIPAAAAFAAGGLPLSVVIAGIAILLLAVTVGELAKKYPSAGGFYTYGTKALGSRVGFLIGWCILLAENLTPALGLWGAAFSAQQIFALAHISTPFWIWVILAALLVYVLMYRGVGLSMRSGVVLGTIEILVFVVLAVLFIAQGGSRNTLEAFTPSFAVHGWSGIFFGMIWVIFAFIGFEAVVPMAEEARKPRTFVQKALIMAPIFVGVFYLLTSYAGVAQIGIGQMASYNANSWVVLSQKVSVFAEAIMLFAVLNSSIAVINSSASAATRVMYAMGRARALPEIAATLHPTFRTPSVAIWFQAVFSVLLALVVGVWQGGPLGAIGWDGEIITILVIIAYYIVGGAISTIVVYSRDFRSERSVVRHIVVPVLATLLMLLPLYASVVPFPPYPISLGPWIVVIWIALGFLLSYGSLKVRFTADNIGTLVSTAAEEG